MTSIYQSLTRQIEVGRQFMKQTNNESMLGTVLSIHNIL
uniref:Uncharacterized protein n=1 Tax=Arundo donax TaxID=35708 RepID=A0A0A9BKM9_ARUDO